MGEVRGLGGEEGERRSRDFFFFFFLFLSLVFGVTSELFAADSHWYF